jgi:hypothetical protein
MEIAKTERLCQNVECCVADVRQVFRSSMPIPEVLDRFWRLQDNLSRLLEALSDDPVEATAAMDGYPSLLQDVVDVLGFVANLQSFRNLPAVREAVESINNSLLEIQYLKQARAMAASA